jgi:hypothetical protein
MEHTECSETTAYKLQTPANHPEESVQHSKHGESLKSRHENVFVQGDQKVSVRLMIKV